MYASRPRPVRHSTAPAGSPAPKRSPRSTSSFGKASAPRNSSQWPEHCPAIAGTNGSARSSVLPTAARPPRRDMDPRQHREHRLSPSTDPGPSDGPARPPVLHRPRLSRIPRRPRIRRRTPPHRPQARARDTTRRRWLAKEMNWEVIPVTKDFLTHPAPYLEALLTALLHRGWNLDNKTMDKIAARLTTQNRRPTNSHAWMAGSGAPVLLSGGRGGSPGVSGR